MTAVATAPTRPKDEGTFFPEAPLTLPMPKLTREQKIALGQTAMTLLDINLGNRGRYDQSLDVWNAMYEQRAQPRNVPNPNSSNYIPPIVPEKVDEIVSRVVGTVFQPRLLTVYGNDPLSSQYSHAVEQFYNDQLTRNEWVDPLETCVHLTARDGVSYARVMWDLQTHQEVRIADDGTRKMIDMVKYDAPRVRAVESRDLVLIPNYAPTIEAADAICCKCYMSEKDLMGMVRAGILDKEMVEDALMYVSHGQGELSRDRQRATTYTVGGLISVTDAAVAAPEGIKMSRGPLEVWMIHTNQYDLNNDGQFEENILWVHDHSRLLLGAVPYEYWGGRPYFDLSIWPRPNRVPGYSVPQRIRGSVEEIVAIQLGRMDYLDYAVNPMRYRTPGARFRSEDRRWGVDAEVEVQKKDDFGFVDPPQWPGIGDAEEERINSYIDRVMASPQAGGQAQGGASQQRSARQAQINAAIMSLQSNTLNRRVRAWLLRIFKFMHSLYQQYGPDQIETTQQVQGGAQTVVLPKEVLALAFTLGIAGMGGALDKEQRRTDMMMLAQFLMGTPLVNGNYQRIWTLCRLVAETYDIPEVTALIGTMDEATQQGQQQAQAADAQQKRDFLMQILSHGAFKPGANKPGQSGAGGGGIPPLAALGHAA